MQAAEAAHIFYDWAAESGLISETLVLPKGSTDAELALVKPSTDVGRQLLRSRQVLGVAFNNARSEVIVFTKRIPPKAKKQAASLPFSVDNVSVVYRQGVQEPIGGIPTVPFGGPAYIVRQAAGAGRYTCGSSISVGNYRDAGTLGCLVRDGNGALYGLSNNHVSGSCSFAGVGLPILAPGIYDVVPNGLNPFTLGLHSRALPMVPGSADNINPLQNLDAAIFSILNDALVSSFQGNAYDTPIAVGPLTPGMDVEKVGRTTGHTRGRVIGQFHGAHPIFYSAAHYNFSGQVYFEPSFTIVGAPDCFSDSGDSGSLITTIDPNGQRIAVGIVVGGMSDGSAPGGKATVALPIEPILNGLNVTLVGGHNL